MVFFQENNRSDKEELRVYGFIVLATAWAPGILTVVTLLVMGHFVDFVVVLCPLFIV